MFARIRKAAVAGLGAGAAAFTAALVAAPAFNRDEFGKALGLGVVAAAGTAWATWRVPNKVAA